MFFFVTGMARSGTTLLDKLLLNHPSLYIASQPFPRLFFQLKADLYQEISHPEQYYLLNNYFNEKLYSVNVLTAFLSMHKIAKSDLQKALANKEQYSGQFHQYPHAKELAEKLSGLSFNEIARELLLELSHNFQDDLPQAIGTKEILAEEFIPYFLENNWKVIIMVRDPRDVIASMNFGKGDKYTGAVKPTLFNLRNWRKSVAFAAKYAQDERVMTVRYEDLVCDPETVIAKITAHLGCDDYPWDIVREQGMVDDKGDLWKANSSHGNYAFVSKGSMGRYKDVLTPEQLKYIELFTFPELNMFSYKNDIDINAVTEQVIMSIDEPFTVTEARFLDKGYDHNAELSIEWQRIKAVLNSDQPTSKQVEQLFIFEEAYNALKMVLR